MAKHITLTHLKSAVQTVKAYIDARISTLDNKLDKSGGTITGDLRLQKDGIDSYGSKLNFGDGEYVYLHEDYDDHLVIYGDKGVDINTNGEGVMVDGETVSTFSGNYSDLSGKPSSFTPSSHASSATTYGKGDASNYGHLRLSDDTSSTSGTSGGIAATPNSVKKAYDLAAAKARTATLVVAASNSSAKSKAAADYVCDGTSDQTEINNAISALPSAGGKVLLLEGTYNISAYINASKSNVTIEGVGNGTVLKRMFNDGSAWNEQGIIYIQGSSIKNCTVKNMRFDGNRSSYTGTNNAAVKVSYSASNITITGLTIENEGNGIIISGAATSCKIAYNTILESNQHGIEIGNVSNTMVCGNYIIDSAVNGILGGILIQAIQ